MWYPSCRPFVGKGICVHWYHCLCVPPSRHKDSEEGSYEVQTAEVKINFDKSEGLRLGTWRGSIPLPGLFHWSDGPVRILGVWFRPGLQLEWNWSEVQAKVDAQVGTWLWRWLSLKGKAEVCTMYIFPLIRYCLSVLPLPKNHQLALQWSLSKLL